MLVIYHCTHFTSRSFNTLDCTHIWVEMLYIDSGYEMMDDGIKTAEVINHQLHALSNAYTCKCCVLHGYKKKMHHLYHANIILYNDLSLSLH